jgi:hypothetical protein
MKQSTAVGIIASWNHRRNGSAHIHGIVNIGSRRVVDSHIIEKAMPSGRGNYRRNSNREKGRNEADGEEMGR